MKLLLPSLRSRAARLEGGLFLLCLRGVFLYSYQMIFIHVLLNCETIPVALARTENLTWMGMRVTDP
jgi:hypothetical protein